MEKKVFTYGDMSSVGRRGGRLKKESQWHCLYHCGIDYTYIFLQPSNFFNHPRVQSGIKVIEPVPVCTTDCNTVCYQLCHIHCG